jgi:hypothetical protein
VLHFFVRHSSGYSKAEKEEQAFRKELWNAIFLIRETVEDFAPPGSVKNSERCYSPAMEAEAICIGVAKIAEKAGRKRRSPSLINL